MNNLKGFASEKVEGGKLVKVKVDYNSNINNVQILGDFFIHPEDGIEDIEKSIKNTPASESEDVIADKVKKIVSEKNILLVGVTPEAIARVVKQAMK